MSESISGVVSSSQINYQQSMFSHPSYRFNSQFPNTFGQAINLTASQTPVTINLPPEVFNLSQSYLPYTVSLPETAAGYIWTPQDTLAEISHIQFYAGSTMYIADIDNLQNYLGIICKKEMELDEFQTLDPLNRMYSNNSVVNVVPAVRNSTVTNTNTPNGPTNPSVSNYNEPAYWAVGALTTAVTYNVQFHCD